MNVLESARVFDCAGDALVGIVTRPETAATCVTGVLIVVGGPQYRIGSHRQFVHLARYLAQRGVASMRFDHRGCGDSTGEARTFDAIDEDIRAAIDVFVAEVPELRRVVLWGLCDAASAACLYARLDRRVGGLVLANPWVRTAGGEARTRLRHYYLKRLIDGSFWAKLASGRLRPAQSVKGFVGAIRAACDRRASRDRESPSADLPFRMAAALATNGAPFLVILSGRDYVAREFEAMLRSRPEWARMLVPGGPGTVVHAPDADHTCSNEAAREEVARTSLDWLAGLDGAIGEKPRP